MRDAECVAFLQWALPRLHMRWPGFRRVRRQVCRRVARRLNELGLADLDAYRERLRDDPAEWAALDACCRVTISRFWRDRAVFESLRERVLPALAARARASGRSRLRAWSAGCSSGEEVYGLQALWQLELARDHPDLSLRIVATDVDSTCLERARRGCYGASSLRELPPGWRERVFEQKAGALWCVRPKLRGDVTWSRQDLRRAAPEGAFDLVLCRNLAFTYFDEELQRRVLDRIVAHLVPGGALAIGVHERLPTGPGALGRLAAWEGARAVFALEGNGAYASPGDSAASARIAAASPSSTSRQRS